MKDPAPGDQIDQYLLTDLIARSGMASIFKAIDAESGQPAVLKIPHVQYESDVVFFERFRREEEIGLALDHPNIVRVLRPREKTRMYLALEYIEGTALSSTLKERRPLPLDRALHIAMQTCEAVAYLHAKGIVHRDIKPENILLTPAGTVKILDFGIAFSEASRRLTWAGLSQAIGTPDYMAPEQIRGRRGDARTDVYALGTLLYEMLTCKLPYASQPAGRFLAAKAGDAATPPSRHVPGFDPALEAVILTAVERAPRDRQADARELLSQLRDPSSATNGEQGARLRPARARRLALLAAGAAVLVGLGWLVKQSHRPRRAPEPGHPASAPASAATPAR